MNKTQKDIEAELARTKKNAIRAAYELGYFRINPNIGDEINGAKTVISVDRIMRTHRRTS